MIIIVGAGPAGLAAAHEAQRRLLPYQVVERYEIGHAWRNHYDRLRLNTLKEVSALPGLPMPTHYPRFPTALQFHTYLCEYAHHFQLNINTGVEVERACWKSSGWEIHTNRGQLAGSALIAATGIWSTPYHPAFPGEEQFGGRVIHSCSYRNPSPFRGQRVLVVGAGNSGSEIAVDLAEAGVCTSIAIRDGVKFVPRPALPIVERVGPWLLEHLPHAVGELAMQFGIRDFSHLGMPRPVGSLLDSFPVVGYALPRAVAAGQARVYPALVGFGAGKAHFEGGHKAPFDAVIKATGYRPSLQFVSHALDFDAHGFPHLDHCGRATRAPRLFCLGFDYPTTRGWLSSLGRVMRRAFDVLVASR